MSDKIKGDVRVFTLMVTLQSFPRGLTRQQIFNVIPAYQQMGDAAERSFERDKEVIRDLGVVLEVIDLSSTESVYRLPKTENRSLKLNLAERSLLFNAASIWFGAEDFSDSARAFKHKVNAIGVSDLPAVKDQISGLSQVLDLLAALTEKRLVEFSYRKLKDDVAQIRRVLPLEVFAENSSLYLRAFDVFKAELRVFRLSRMGSCVGILEVAEPELVSAAELAFKNDDRGVQKFSPLLLVSETVAKQAGLWAVRYETSAGLPEIPEGVSGYSYWRGNPATAMQWLERCFELGSQVLVVEPLVLSERIKQLCSEFLERTDADGQFVEKGKLQ
ncbi:hypothetical protein HMPREF0044_1288 [Gleimia coleocanis DSM 15436]|uniref:WYL domain-containing protein n=1 Tax=Gleimia coleocanis DSM 15436 TaxID=525245 RepID=C0W1J8_9ACTO|nr:WYL domain-containing protein [Gleimia coleocanis]EEH63364.1 hypothetical protein HMPREF0044_1288 [Gleimia coleocanis DSM 15436]